MARLTWVLAVSGETNSSTAISSLDIPVATRATTSRSRGVSADSASGDGNPPVTSGWARNRVMRPRVARGDSRASPAATVRIPASSSSGSTPFAEEPARARPQRREDVLVNLEGGQDQHLHPVQVLVGADRPGRLQSVEVGHP